MQWMCTGRCIKLSIVYALHRHYVASETSRKIRISYKDRGNLILCSIVNYSLLTMSESTKRPHDDESEDSADGLIGPMPSEAAKPKKHKCKSVQWTMNIWSCCNKHFVK